jgi:YgiT-type zinc finger domain-containing protein
MVAKKIKYFQEWKNKNIIFENVPVTECTVCRERLFDGNTVEKINEILWELPAREIKKVNDNERV